MKLARSLGAEASYDLFTHLVNNSGWQSLRHGTLERHRLARIELANDGDQPIFITDDMKQLPVYKDSIHKLTEKSTSVSQDPCRSGRRDMSAMIYNPNNVATEASPHTTDKEREVGVQLSEMLGYNRQNEDPAPWGHLTCDGSVANLEAIWATRNLKFYPFSLKLAIENGPLKFLSIVEPPFVIKTCNAGEKKFLDLTKEELLNLTPPTVLSIPTLLNRNYSITPVFLQEALKPYLVQTTGTDELERRFDINPGKYMICATKHYSWPKGGAITGIGSEKFVNVDVDNEARMDTEDLKRKLDECIEKKTPIFGVVAIMGSTEHGACDPLSEIISIRDEYEEKKGVSFAVHCDAAWGGYFASLLRERHVRRGPPDLPYVPGMSLSPYTKKQLEALKDADSITIDPHNPIVFHDGDEKEEGSMGVYGVEGSKPGASAVATWLSHQSLRLDKDGYGTLLGETIFSCTKLYCHWATMTPRPEDGLKHKVPADALIVAPLIRLPSERIVGEDVELQKAYIREAIVGRDNKALREDHDVWALMRELGGDLMINAFATNFKIGDEVNQDVGEANYLNQWIFSKPSVSSQDDVINERPLFLTSSEFGEEAYGKCLETFKRRLGLTTTDEGGNVRPSRGDLRFLVNVTMSPWPTSPDFMSSMVEDFRNVAERGVERCLLRNTRTPDFHGFVVQGLEEKTIYFTHIAMFNMANHRRQLYIAAELPADVHSRYRKERSKNPGESYTIANVEQEKLEDMLEALLKPDTASKIKFRLDKGIPAGEDAPPPVEKGFALSNVRVVVDQSMPFAALDLDYPAKMPFYLYGSKREVHVDHVLKKAPNAQISADLVKTDLAARLTDEELRNGVVVMLDDVFEASLQPLPIKVEKNKPELEQKKPKLDLEALGLSLKEGVDHKAVGKTVYADWDDVNMDPTAENDGIVPYH
ncbi:hypothetical protein CMUS01_13598 [Colletotrichum musicola]|uniref:Pyridoxal-dependent decarboxylase domain-containing protein n=1 Tax=Colletotrichum musicola TaxID=2175873 RepID=A0A8H6JBR9_9PEZI|nr:hypothetical protein CMUS01_13598 [Colletotrichum musicola]